jgi:hypothetical protein
MNETEWLASNDPAKMLEWLMSEYNRGHPDWFKRPSDRKLRLFSCACCRQVWGKLTDERSRRSVEIAEAFAEGKATESEITLACRDAAIVAEPGSVELAPAYLRNIDQIDSVLRVVGGPRVGWPKQSLAFAADLLRHIIGNLFRPPLAVPCGRCRGEKTILDEYDDGVFSLKCDKCKGRGHLPGTPPVLTGHVMRLADALYNGEDCAFALHDALLDCGATELAKHFATYLLSDSSHGGDHPKGCWAVDLILGKE